MSGLCKVYVRGYTLNFYGYGTVPRFYVPEMTLNYGSSICLMDIVGI